VIAVALAERTLVAIDQEEWARADTIAEQAVWTAHHSRSEETPLHALVYAVAARTALHTEREANASELLTDAQRRLPRLTYVCPIPSVQTRLEMARAYLLLADHAGAHTMLTEIDAVLRRCPDLGTLGTQASELRARLGAPGHDVPGASALTAAELRVLPLLATHLSYREIGERRFLSRHTVKSHTMSIYRKLDVNSRSEAIERAREIGLL
jgi:LuxR family maltose regulon positive regulatory protein